MINLASILNDLLGAVIVVSALIIIAVIIKLIVSAFSKKPAEYEESEEPAVPSLTKAELKLINVDEKTAALIMAIVSHESEIPLSELVFTSIKLV